MMFPLDAVVWAARRFLPELPELLGDDAEPVQRELEALIARAEAGEDVTDDIFRLLRSDPRTQAPFDVHLFATLPQAAPPGEPEPAAAAPQVEPEPTRAKPRAAPMPIGAEPPPEQRPTAAAPPRSRIRLPRLPWPRRSRGTRAKPPPSPEPRTREMPRALPRDDDLAVEANGGDAAPAERWILAQVWELSRPLQAQRMQRAFLAGAEHAIKVKVGPIDDAWITAEGAGPEDSVDARLEPGAVHVLAAIFFVPSLGVKDRKTLTLPASGPSDVVSFSLPPFAHETPVEAWISLVHEGRHVQSARLRGFALDDPGAAPDEAVIGLQWTAIAPGLAEPGVREPFDASVLLDARGDGVAAVGVPNADALVTFDDEDLGTTLTSIRTLLRRLVDAPGQFTGLNSEGSVALLRELAFQGRILHEVIGERLAAVLPEGTMRRIQLVQTDRIDHVPIEFLYELPTPSEDATLCDGWIEQVHIGSDRCPDVNHPPAARPGQVTKVCPLGFWALTRVIERQVLAASEARSDGFAVHVAPTAARSQLAPVGPALFGFSERLDAVEPGRSTTVLETLNGVTDHRAVVVSTWEDWANAIAERPSLLVLLAHTVQHQSVSALEIGPEGERGSRIKLIELVPQFVRVSEEDAPVVLVLGCDTAVERNEFRSFVAQFVDAGAALVVGTISPVLGERVTPVAQRLITELATPGGTVATFGELMLDLRRRLLADGELTALCITSFGDADWRLARG